MQNEFLRIQTGKFKNQKISIPVSIKGNSNFTSSILKKSIFSILESISLNGMIEKENSTFIDLFSASGQIGIESASIGFKRIIFFELDSNRFKDLKQNINQFNFLNELYHKDSFRFHSKFEKKESESLVFFIDPPYIFWEKQFQKLEKLFQEIEESNPINKLILIIQAPKEYSLKNFSERIIGNQKLLLNF